MKTNRESEERVETDPHSVLPDMPALFDRLGAKQLRLLELETVLIGFLRLLSKQYPRLECR